MKRVMSAVKSLSIGVALGVVGFGTVAVVADKADALQPEQFPNSSNIEFENKGFLFYNDNNCYNTAVYNTPSGQMFLVGSKEAISKCRNSVGTMGVLGIDSQTKHVSYLTRVVGQTAVSEVVHQSAYAFGTPRSQLYYASIFSIGC